jgi:hypothetical protein
VSKRLRSFRVRMRQAPMRAWCHLQQATASHWWHSMRSKSGPACSAFINLPSAPACLLLHSALVHTDGSAAEQHGAP